MMKKLMAVLLVAVMLMGMLPMTAVAETTTPQFKGYTLFLKESIAISFYAEPANLEGFTKVVFYKNDQVMETIATLPRASSDGLVYFTFSKLGPHEMGAEIKAELYINGALTDTRTKSVLEYCTTKLGAEDSSAQLKTLIVDMLNYGAAAQTYVAEENATEAGTLVNAGLTTAQINLGAISDPQLELLEGLDTALDGAEVTWKQASLTLNSGIVMNFAFSVESTEGLTMELTRGEKTWTVSEFGEKVINGATYTTCEFDGLNPAQMRDVVYIVAKRDGVEISDKKAYSVEHYAAAKVSDLVSSAITDKTKKEETSLVNLVNAMMQYGDAAAMYANEHTYDANGKCTACNVAHYAVGNKAVWLEAEEMDLLSKREYDLRWAEKPDATQDANKKPVTVETTGVVRFNRDQAPSSATNVAHLSFETTATADGTYSIWIKAYAKDTKNPHLFVSVDADGATPEYKGFKPTAASASTTALIWFKLGEYAWTEGQDYTVRIRGYYSAFPRIDQIVITKDSAFKPDEHTHTIDIGEYVHDEEYHWNEASCCQGVTANKAEHTFVNMVCSVCNANYLDQVTVEAEDANLFQGIDSTNKNTSGTANYAYTAFDNEFASGIKKVYRLNGYYTAIPAATMPAEKQACLDASNPAHMSFAHIAEHTGTYYIWAKVLASQSTTSYLKYIDGDGTSADSQYVYTSHTVTPYDATHKWGSNTFSWVLVGEYEWTAGNTYTVRFRGSGLTAAFDQFVVTNDATFNPA
ncbi:MAG: hypothetical protein E7468_03690 [Ruminococcaceae bacterium]|nr:hypothetical protein [Oscillospiraceae bacterium]